MAERVQRFLWDNRVLAADTILSATSQQPGFPVAFIRDPLRTKAWRSAVGWTVVAGFNDKLDFTEDGNNRVATLAAGTYSTAATMASTVQTAMNAAPGVSNTYTVSYASSTFTIARNTGTAVVVLKFGAGAANFAASVHLDLGYTSSDKSGGTSYLAQSASYQSRHAILIDLGAAFSVSAIGILLAGQVGMPTSIQGNSTTFVGVGGLATPTFAGPSMNSALELAFPGGEFLRYWRVVVANQSNPAGYSEVSVVFVGAYVQPSRSHLSGNSVEAEMLTSTSRGDQGGIFRNAKNAPKRYLVQFRSLTEDDRAAYQAMEDASIGKHIFFARDALNDTVTWAVYGVIEAPANTVHSIGDGTPPDRYAITVTFLEELG